MKIAEGCDHPCTFCVIPQYRGNFRSRRFESVISEATRLFGQGVREINLIGQDTTCYGEDFGLKDGLAQLLARLAQIETPQPKWVRFLYAYPEQGHAETARHHRGARRSRQVHRHAAAARQRPGAQADEARGVGRHLPEADRTHSPDDSRRGHPHQFHRRISRRNRRRFRNALPVRRSRATRPSGRLLLLRRRHQQKLRARRQGRWPHDFEP